MKPYLFKSLLQAGEMIWQLRALADFLGDLSGPQSPVPPVPGYLVPSSGPEFNSQHPHGDDSRLHFQSIAN